MEEGVGGWLGVGWCFGENSSEFDGLADRWWRSLVDSSCLMSVV